MLLYIDPEHPAILRDPDRRAKHLLQHAEEKARFEELSGRPCLLLHYWQFAGQDWLRRLQPRAVLLSGMCSEWSSYEREGFDALLDFIRDWERPMIGLCGGHQLIAHAYGAEVGPMRALNAGESDPRPEFGGGCFKELGVHAIDVVGHDTLFAGLPDQVDMVEEHYWEVKALPVEFELLAGNPACQIQAMQHRQRPLFGTQFHPERWSAKHPDGRQLLQNFFAMIS